MIIVNGMHELSHFVTFINNVILNFLPYWDIVNDSCAICPLITC